MIGNKKQHHYHMRVNQRGRYKISHLKRVIFALTYVKKNALIVKSRRLNRLLIGCLAKIKALNKSSLLFDFFIKTPCLLWQGVFSRLLAGYLA